MAAVIDIVKPLKSKNREAVISTRYLARKTLEIIGTVPFVVAAIVVVRVVVIMVNVLYVLNVLYTVKPLYTDIRFNDKIRYNDI